MAVFAALSAIVCRFIPGIPIVGVPEASIKFDAALAPIYGLVIGPYLGFLAALFGGLIVAGSFFSVLTSFCTAVSALVAGLLVREKCSFRGYTVNGWVLAALVLGLLILGWYGTWVGQQAPLYPVLHLFGLFIILTFRGRIATYFKGDKGDIANEGRWVVKPYYVMPGILVMFSAYIISKPYWLDLGWTDFLPYLSLPLYFLGGIAIVYGIFGGGEGKRKVAFAIGLSSYCGIIADHMLGNLIFIGVINIIIPLEIIQEYFLEPLGLPSIPSLFMYMIPVSAVERFLITAIATIFGIGLILALYRGGLLSQDGRKYK
ncbi:MAG: hypothetical protein ACUVRA_01260 [Candidatus Bathyarchaeaceae archaeon]